MFYSPSKNIAADLSLLDGEAGFQILFHGRPVLEIEHIKLSGTGFSDQDLFCSDHTVKERRIDEKYSLPAGKERVYENVCNEYVLSFPSSAILTIRIYDDGFAYRIDAPQDCDVVVTDEGADFSVIDLKEIWLQKWVDTYEGPFDNKIIEDGQRYGMPVLGVSDENGWILLSEAEVISTDGLFCSSSFMGKNGKLHLSIAPEEKNGLHLENGIHTPWRFAAIASSLERLFDSRLVCNLNRQCEVEDTSFVKPGRALWSWWSFENGAQLLSEQMKYVDMASALGFEYVTVDAGWDDSWVEALCSYAGKKNVGIWIWSDMQSLADPLSAREKIEKWAGWGVVGLKVDFFMNDSMQRMNEYTSIANIMSENRLMINFHGNTKAAGEVRTWPNLMTEEGIMGLEHYKWSSMPDAKHNVTVPFTRNLVGSMDYTPVGFSNSNRNTTQAHQLALSVVFESGVLHVAESIHSLLPWKGLEFLKLLSASYDETKLIDGYPGEYAVVMKRNSDKWYIGGITDKERTVKVSLDFLFDGDFKAVVYTDGHGDWLETCEYDVNRSSCISLKLKEHGGFAFYIARTKNRFSIKTQNSGYLKKAEYSYDVRTLCNEYEECHETGGYCISLRGRKVVLPVSGCGDYILRILYASSASAGITVNKEHRELEPTGGKDVYRVADINMKLHNSRSVRLSSDDDIFISSAELIKADMPPVASYSAVNAVMQGSAHITEVPSSDRTCAGGICSTGAVMFKSVEVPAAGRYILAFDYYSGHNKKVEISVNGRVYSSTFFNTGGWVEGNWSVCGRKELLVPLDKGENTIVFSSPETEGPLLDSLHVISFKG